ncbi:hypothetical protein ABZ618_07125 [Streptomyces roseolus]|uniref:hypothetical protein n=1 Tax=Streptomyces roseolus TaxID=67358 RepID=UPI0033DD4D94
MLVPPVDVMRRRSADAVPAQAPAPRELQYSLTLDGFRALAFVLEGGRGCSRRGPGAASPELPDVAAVPAGRLPPGIVLDGELCAYREGRIGFTDRMRDGVPVSYIAFGLLAVPGRDVRALPRDRWKLLGTRTRGPRGAGSAICGGRAWRGSSPSAWTRRTAPAPPGPGGRSGARRRWTRS